MIAVAYLAIFTFFGDALASRWFSFVSLPHRLATGFLVGLLTGTWISYLTALLAVNAADPMAIGALASSAVMLVSAIWLRRHPTALGLEGLLRLRSVRWEWILVLLVTIVAGAMMIWTYHYADGSLWIAGDLWSDFGPTSAISQSFALGHNFPTEYPHYAGEPIRYHFLYYFQTGNLTYLGLDPATANNVLSIASLVSMLVIVAALGERLFGSRSVGWLAGGLFFFHGALSFIPYLGTFPSLGAALASLPSLDHFLSSGFPYRGEEWGIWTQDVYLNQRHLPSAIGILLVVVLFLLDRLPRPHLGPPQPGLDGVRRRLATSARGLSQGASATFVHPIAVFRSTLRDPWLPGYLLCGLLAGLLPLYNGAIFIASAVVLGVMLVAFPNRAQMIGLALVAAIVAVPQLMFLRPGTMAGEQAYPAFHWGYVVDDPTPLRVATYLGFIFGPKLLLAGISLAAGTWRQARVFLAFVALVALAFLVQFSVEALANHKFIHTWLIVANVFVAFGLVRLWESRPSAWVPTRLIAIGLAGVIVAGGLIDLVPIKNERMYQTGLDGDPLYEWVRTTSKPQDVFLSDFYVVHGILLAGRKVYLGWPYYSWSAGYAVEQRQQWYRDVFALRSARELVSRLQAAKIAYVAFDDGLRDRGFAPRLNEELYRDHFDVAFSDPDNHYGHLTIYRVPTDRDAAAALPEAPAADMYIGGRGADLGLFMDPGGIAVESSGAVLVADRGNNRVQRFSSDGNYLSSIGGQDAGPGQLIEPTGVAVGPDGIVYLAAGDRLLAFGPMGNFVRALSVPGLAAPRWVDIAIDRDGAIFALDAADGLVARFAVDGAITTFGNPGSGDGQLHMASGLAVRDGTLAIADPGNGRITVFHGADGTFVRALPVSEWQGADALPADVAVGDDGTIWASSPATNAILVYRPDGTLAGSLAPGGADALDGPTGLALGSGGRLFVTNAAGSRVTLLTSLQP
ncbi:MAG: hypothetical protein ABI598_02535 [Chloroflexota bacterium]